MGEGYTEHGSTDDLVNKNTGIRCEDDMQVRGRLNTE